MKELTAEQEVQLEEWKDRWVAISISTERADQPRAEKAFADLYTVTERKVPPFVWTESPLAANTLINLLEYEETIDKKNHILTPLILETPESKSVVFDDLEKRLINNSTKFAGSVLIDDTTVQFEVTLDAEFKVHYTPFLGQIDGQWIGYYLFCREVLGVEYDAEDNTKLDIFSEIAQSTFWWWPFEEVVIISDRPTQFHLSDTVPPELHRDGGPALQFIDEWSEWLLNGVHVKQEIAETPADELDSKLIVSEQNAEVRREIVRKIGIERILEDLKAQVVDEASYNAWFPKQGSGAFGFDFGSENWELRTHNYQLLNLNWDGRDRHYLRMLNPSEEVEHVEGVPNEVTTVGEARAWRQQQEGPFQPPDILT